MPTIAHISDLHLQSGVAERQAQVEPILQKINAMKPDLVVISGDVTDDGWDSIEELKWAKDWLDERIDGEWFAVPGNHDVGNFVTQSEGNISLERVKPWEQLYRWNPGTMLPNPNSSLLKGWSICGFNSMVFGSEIVFERLQIELVENWANQNSQTPEQDKLAFITILHSPLFIDKPMEDDRTETNYWLGPAKPRKQFWTKLNSAGTKLICSGHVHQSRLTEVDGVKIAWAPPASGTWVHAPGLPNPPMPEQTGFFLHHLHDDGTVASELIECAPMLKLYEHNPWP